MKSIEVQLESCKGSLLKSYELTQTSLRNNDTQSKKTDSFLQSPPKSVKTKKLQPTPKQHDESILLSAKKQKSAAQTVYYATAKQSSKHSVQHKFR